jgi:hypothetical protein
MQYLLRYALMLLVLAAALPIRADMDLLIKYSDCVVQADNHMIGARQQSDASRFGEAWREVAEAIFQVQVASRLRRGITNDFSGAGLNITNQAAWSLFMHVDTNYWELVNMVEEIRKRRPANPNLINAVGPFQPNQTGNGLISGTGSSSSTNNVSFGVTPITGFGTGASSSTNAFRPPPR